MDRLDRRERADLDLDRVAVELLLGQLERFLLDAHPLDLGPEVPVGLVDRQDLPLDRGAESLQAALVAVHRDAQLRPVDVAETAQQLLAELERDVRGERRIERAELAVRDAPRGVELDRVVCAPLEVFLPGETTAEVLARDDVGAGDLGGLWLDVAGERRRDPERQVRIPLGSSGIDALVRLVGRVALYLDEVVVPQRLLDRVEQRELVGLPLRALFLLLLPVDQLLDDVAVPAYRSPQGVIPGRRKRRPQQGAGRDGAFLGVNPVVPRGCLLLGGGESGESHDQ